jgi:uncharacterized protein (TIGR03067 family)
MRTRSLVVLVMPVLLAAQGAEGESKKDLERLQGTWKAVSSETDGKKWADDIMRGYTLTVKNDEFTEMISMDMGGGKVSASVSKSTVSLDATKKPKAIDYEFNQGGKKVTSLGIYRLEGDTLTICSSRPGKERPTRFESKVGSGWSLTVYKRPNAGK